MPNGAIRKCCDIEYNLQVILDVKLNEMKTSIINEISPLISKEIKEELLSINIDKKMKQEVDLNFEAFIQEMKTRESRKKNAIHFNIKDDDNKLADKKIIDDFIEKTYIKKDDVKQQRLGEYKKGSFRPLKIVLPTLSDSLWILKNAEGDIMNSDKIPRQINLYKYAKSELEERTKKGETDLK